MIADWLLEWLGLMPAALIIHQQPAIKQQQANSETKSATFIYLSTAVK